jgi:hypothetical protein
MTASSEAGARPPGAFYQSVLTPHPSTPCEAVRSIRVRLTRDSGGSLDLAYALAGDLRAVHLPRRTARRRADGLWRRTCFEVFVAPDPGTAYVELNFSPSGEWAGYTFERYRKGMAATDGRVVPAITVVEGTGGPAVGEPRGPGEASWTLHAAVRIGSLEAGTAARVALAAVIEGVDGRLCYWALRHPPGKPDFHHPDGFALRI